MTLDEIEHALRTAPYGSPELIDAVYLMQDCPILEQAFEQRQRQEDEEFQRYWPPGGFQMGSDVKLCQQGEERFARQCRDHWPGKRVAEKDLNYCECYAEE